MGAELVHFEIAADDLEKMASFYRETLGWTIEPGSLEYPDYLVIKTSDREDMPCGGMMKKMMPEQGLL
ncbi:MAG: hypothetical protein KJ625_01695, partial [Actinobacteria bacterium]|nr:hypothetical protein [Actinomycetota bacterium]